jgi:hypothetical protein
MAIMNRLKKEALTGIPTKNDKSQDDSGAIDMNEEEGVPKEKKSGGTGNIRGDSVITEVDITEQTKTRTSKRKRNNKGE